MKEIIHVDDHRSQLHCDNAECLHELPEGAVTWGPHLIGYPCPKCGHSMLTKEDYIASERMARAIRWINRWFGWMGEEYKPDTWPHSVSIRHHNGEVIYKAEDRDGR